MEASGLLVVKKDTKKAVSKELEHLTSYIYP